jgi:hypothetical protein
MGMIEDDGQAYADYDDDDEEGGKGRLRGGAAPPAPMRPSELSGAIELLQQQRLDEFGSEDADEVLRRVLQLEEGGVDEASGSTTSLSSKVGGFFRIGFGSSSTSPGSSASTKRSSGGTAAGTSSSGREDDLDEGDEEDVCIEEEDD